LNFTQLDQILAAQNLAGAGQNYIAVGTALKTRHVVTDMLMLTFFDYSH